MTWISLFTRGFDRYPERPIGKRKQVLKKCDPPKGFPFEPNNHVRMDKKRGTPVKIPETLQKRRLE